MDSKEPGLVAVQQLFKLHDLHYSFWEVGENASVDNIAKAQKKYTSFLINHIAKVVDNKEKRRILDVGCGIGTTAKELLKMGYKVDGIVPSNWMAKLAEKSLQDYRDETKGNIYESSFEDFLSLQSTEKYQVVFFSESYQYIDMQKSFDVLDSILAKTGTVIIFDFFKKDGVKGKSPLGGGHSIGEF